MKSRSRLLPAYLGGNRATLDFIHQFQSYGNREKNNFQSKLKINTRFKGQTFPLPESNSFQNIIHPTTDSQQMHHK